MMIDYPEFPVTDDPEVIYESDILDPETTPRACEYGDTCDEALHRPEEMVSLDGRWMCHPCSIVWLDEAEAWKETHL